MGEIASRSFEGAFGRAGRTGKDLAHEFKHSAVGRQLPLVVCSCEPTREVSHALWGYVQGQPGAYAGTVDAALYLVMKHGVRTAAESGSTRHFEFGAGLDPGINATCRNIWRTGIWISAHRYVASAEVCAHEVLSGVVKDDVDPTEGSSLSVCCLATHTSTRCCESSACSRFECSSGLGTLGTRPTSRVRHGWVSEPLTRTPKNCGHVGTPVHAPTPEAKEFLQP